MKIVITNHVMNVNVKTGNSPILIVSDFLIQGTVNSFKNLVNNLQ